VRVGGTVHVRVMDNKDMTKWSCTSRGVRPDGHAYSERKNAPRPDHPYDRRGAFDDAPKGNGHARRDDARDDFGREAPRRDDEEPPLVDDVSLDEDGGLAPSAAARARAEEAEAAAARRGGDAPAPAPDLDGALASPRAAAAPEPAAPPPLLDGGDAASPEVRPGDVRRGAVVKLFPYGVFVTLDGGREGLLHKSKCGPGAKGKAHVPGKGDVVFVRVLEVKGDGRVAFSTLDVDPKTGRDRAARGKKRKSAPEPEPEPAAPADDAPAPADDDDDDEYDAGDGGDDDRGQLLSIGVDGLDDEPAAPKPAAKPAKKRPKYQAVEITVADESSSPTVRKIAWSKSKRDKPPPPPPPAAPPPKKAKKASALAAPPEPKEFGVKSFAEIMAEKKKKQT